MAYTSSISNRSGLRPDDQLGSKFKLEVNSILKRRCGVGVSDAYGVLHGGRGGGGLKISEKLCT